MKSSVIVFLMVILAFSITGCGSWLGSEEDVEPINEKRLPAEMSDLQINKTEIETQPLGGYGFFIRPGLEDTLSETHPNGFFGDMVLESPQDILTAKIQNEGEVPLTFILKFFYNYLETEFKILGDTSYRSDFIFTIEPGQVWEIPFQLPHDLTINEYVNKLTAGIFSDPQFHAHWNEHLKSYHDLILNSEIRFEGHQPLVLSQPPTIPIREIDELMFRGAMLNFDFDPGPLGATRPPSLLQVSPGEMIEFGFVANGWGVLPEIVDHYLFFVMADWQQIPVNDAPYLWLKTDGEDRGQHGKVMIEAPLEPGFYDMIAITVLNPTADATIFNYYPLEISERFTLQVVE